MQIKKINKQQIITGIFAAACLAGYVFFPAEGFFQYKLSALAFLIFLPFLYGKYFLRENIFAKKFEIGNWKKNIFWLLIGLFLAFLVMAGIFQFTDLGKHYFLSPKVKNDFKEFLNYQFLGVILVVLVYELFFRGFVMSYFAKFSPKWSIFWQSLFFLILILMYFDLPYWFYVTYLVFTPFAGFIFYQTKSLIYSFVGQLFFNIMVDATFIALTVAK